MAQNAGVPKFEIWENDGGVPYTQCFDKARKGKNSAKLINPNDPLQSPEAIYDVDIPVPTIPSRPQSSEGSARGKHGRQNGRQDANEHQVANFRSPGTSDQPKRQRDQDRRRTTSRNNSGQELSAERSPLHPRVHVRAVSKGGVFSPGRERSTSSERHGLAPSTPGRTKMKSGDRSDHSFEKASAVPKFGEWDVMDPASADSYSYIFNQVREEKQSGSRIPSTNRGSYSKGQRQKMITEPTDVCCFSCFKS